MWGLKSSSAPTLYWLSPRPASFLRLSAEDTEADTVKANTRLEEELDQCSVILSLHIKHSPEKHEGGDSIKQNVSIK